MTPGRSTPTSLQVGTADVGEAEDVLRRMGAPARIAPRPQPRGSAFRFDLSARGDDEVAFASFDVAGGWSAHVQLDVVVVALALRGAIGWRSGREDGVLSDSPTAFPVGRSVVEVDGPARVFEVQFSTPALFRFARDYYDVEYVHLELEPGGARSPRHRDLVVAALQYARTFSASGAATDPSLLAALKANLAAALLSGFRVSGPRREWRLSDFGRRRTYRRAAEFIEANAHRPITPLDAAREAAVPLELLEASFRLQTGGSVGAYLGTARTIGAHGDLVRSAGDDALPGIARRWGFVSTRHLLRAHAELYPRWEVPAED